MALDKILPIGALETYADIWALIDTNFEKLVESVEIPTVGVDANKIKLKLFDGSYITSPAIPFPILSAINGVNLNGTAIELGGDLTKNTVIDTDTFSFLIQNGVGAQRIRLTNLYTELAGALELRIAPPSIDASTASVGDLLQVVDDNTGECDYGIIKETHFTSLSIVSDKVRLTFKDGTFLETAAITFPTEKKAVVTKNNIATNTTAVINVWTKILGTCTDQVLTGFTHDGSGRFTLISGPGTFKVTRISSLSASNNNQVIQTQIYKNGAAVGALTQENQISSNVLQNRTTVAYVTLNAGDYIECWARSISNNMNITENYTTQIIEEI